MSIISTSISTAYKSQLYTIEQKDYNFDGQRDICFYPQQDSKPIIYLWSTAQGKYIKAKSDSINSYPIIVQDLKFIVTQQSDDNQNCYTWEMYQYTNNKFVLYSKTHKRLYKRNLPPRRNICAKWYHTPHEAQPYL